MEFGNRKNLTIAVAILAVLIIGGLVIFSMGGDSEREKDVAAELEEGEIAVSGEIECLPYRAEVAVEECVKGIKADGKIYAIDSAEVGFIENSMEEGTEVTATGELEAAASDNQESNVFRYDGLLILSSLEEK